jgi:hypothetical protein
MRWKGHIQRSMDGSSTNKAFCGAGSWRPLADGLPQSQAYVTVLRQAFCTDREKPLGPRS